MDSSNEQSKDLVARVNEFVAFLDQLIEREYQRPYREKENIEHRVEIYMDIKSKFLSLHSQAPALEPDSKLPSLEDLQLSTRIRSTFRYSGIDDLHKLLNYTEHELLVLRNFGQTSLSEVKTKLQQYGLALKRSI